MRWNQQRILSAISAISLYTNQASQDNIHTQWRESDEWRRRLKLFYIKTVKTKIYVTYMFVNFMPGMVLNKIE